jgi:hypothetical protein
LLIDIQALMFLSATLCYIPHDHREPIADLLDAIRRHFHRLILANMVKGRVSVANIGLLNIILQV